MRKTAGSTGLCIALMMLFSRISLFGQVVINGTITDESKHPIADASIQVEGQRAGSAKETTADPSGAFYFTLDQAGEYFLSASSPGFFPVKRRSLNLVTGTNLISIELIPVGSSNYTVDVYPEKNLVVEHIASSQAMTEAEILSVPATRSNFLSNMMAALPGAVKDQKGYLHFFGSPSEEINWLLDGFSAADPSSGQFDLGLSVEAVKSFDLFSGRYSVEFGKGSGGAMLIQRGMGDNHWVSHLTNFVPGVDLVRGLRLGSFRPRYTLSGPVAKNKVWFFDGFDFNFKQNVFLELPEGHDRTLDWTASNLFRIQANLTPSHILNAGFLFNYLNAPKSGLSPLDPPETTLDKRARRYFYDIKDQITLPSKTIFEFGYAAYRAINREVPQGKELFQYTPFGQKGNYFADTLRLGKRDQWLARVFLPAFQRLGNHQVKVGLDFDYSRYSQDITRTGYEYFRVDGSRAYRVDYKGNGKLDESNLESAAFLQDQWAIKTWLVTEAGVRWDRDRILSKSALTPRLSFALKPPWLANTKFSAGLGLVPAATYLRLFTRNLDQYTVSTRFANNGETLVGEPAITIFKIDRDRIKIPNIRNLSVGVEQKLPVDFFLRANYLRRRGHKGYAFFPTFTSTPLPGSGIEPTEKNEVIYELQNTKLDIYDAVEIALTNQFFRKWDWFCSYVRSRAFSNAALDINIDDPVIFSNFAGPPPWDVPNRLVSWGILPITKNNSIQYFLEWRDGFPFSVHDDEGRQVGLINSWEFPRYFSFNLHFERKFQLARRLWALRLGVDNVTNRENYTLVNNNISSPDFLHFYGRQPRKLVVRIRLLGKV